MSLPSPIIAVLAHFQPLFTAPTWRKVVMLLVGTLTSPRTSNRHSRRRRCNPFRWWINRTSLLAA
jgi:hypothetical protein